MITSYLYGVSRKDHINYAYISSVEMISGTESVALNENELTTEQRRITLPVFKDMVNYIHEMAEKKLSNPSEGYTYGSVRLSYTLETYTEVIEIIIYLI
jgi:proteasome component ECM29